MRDYIKKTYLSEVEKIKMIFDRIDSDKNGYLNPSELNTVSEELGAPLTLDQLNLCLKSIDTDKSGTITFDEFAVWWIGGKEGAPENFGKSMATFVQKYSNAALK